MDLAAVTFHIGEESRVMTIDPSKETLAGLFPELSRESRFIFNGLVLAPAFTLEFLGIGNGAHIWVVKPRSIEGIEKWNWRTRGKFSAGAEAMDRKSWAGLFLKYFGRVSSEDVMPNDVEWLRASSLIRELARVKDGNLRKMDASGHCFRKIACRFLRLTSKEQEPREPSDPSVFATADAPSTSELPVFWT
jgi:hypothetical protein